MQFNNNKNEIALKKVEIFQKTRHAKMYNWILIRGHSTTMWTKLDFKLQALALLQSIKTTAFNQRV
jgi:hypothetical protein